MTDQPTAELREAFRRILRPFIDPDDDTMPAPDRDGGFMWHDVDRILDRLVAVPAVPVSSPPPDQTAEVDQLRADLEHETERRQRWQRKYNAEHVRHVEVVRSFVTDRAAVLLWAADQIDAETRQAKTDGVLEPDKFRPCRDASAQLRALAGCQECASGLEHNTHCPTPETHNWGCGCPTDPVPADGPSRLAAEAQQPDSEKAADTQTWPLIKGNCPACRQASLFLGTGGYPTCSNSECPEPDAATTVLEQYAHEAHPPNHAWRVETRDPIADQWAPGSHFAHRPNAVQRRDTANRTAPLWEDGTPVERRIVRETTTYTVDQPAGPGQKPASQWGVCDGCEAAAGPDCDCPPASATQDTGRV